MLIAFNSKEQGAGKDAAAKFIKEWCEEQGIYYERRAFADKMKLLAAEALGFHTTTGDDKLVVENVIETVDAFKLNGDVNASISTKDASPVIDITDHYHTQGRDFIINLAEGARTLFGQDFWTKVALDGIHWRSGVRKHQIGTEINACIAITDLSYDSEAQAVHDLGGMVVKVINPRATQSRLRPGLGVHDRKSIDLSLYNFGTLDDWRNLIRAFMVSL